MGSSAYILGSSAYYIGSSVALSKAGGTLTGGVVAHNGTDYGTFRIRNVAISTAEATGGNNGDIWIQYTV